jgi:glutamine amidotransferase-like uncharacterized protein
MKSKYMPIKNEINSNDIIIKIAILAEEPLGWGSGKHYFPVILNNYTWKINENTFRFNTEYVYDKDILRGKLNIKNFDVFLVPGGGVGDGESIVKGFSKLKKVKKWKEQIKNFIKDGGGYVGICGGTALMTELVTKNNHKKNFIEKLYDKSSLGVSSIKSYYKELSMPIFNFYQKNPEKVGAMSYVFSFSPGKTLNGTFIHSGGIPIDFIIKKDNPIFSKYQKETERIRWWGGPALIIPNNSKRNIKILANYPDIDISQNENTRIFAWKYIGGIKGLIKGIYKALKLIKKEKSSLKNLPIYSFFLAGDWEKTDKIIDLDNNSKACIASEIYPNNNKGRIILCAAHPEYMIWEGGKIIESCDNKNKSLAVGLHKWININNLSKTIENELTHTWWIVRRLVAWAGKVSDDSLPPKIRDESNEKIKKIISENILWDGTIIDQINNI